MTALVAIVGRPNVGKSTLFNRLTKTRQALVDDLPGVTRDRLYGRVETPEGAFTLIDTGGFDPPADQSFATEVQSQIQAALAEADVILFLADGRQGMGPADFEVADTLRRTEKPVILAVNKLDSPDLDAAAAEFHALGLDRVHFISSAHGRGIAGLLQAIFELLSPASKEAEPEDENRVGVALLGKPNVGKSSLLNALLGEPRVVVSEVPGTTRDAVDTFFQKDGKSYLLIDTAGIRRQGKIRQGLEKASVFRALRTMERTQVAVVLIDAADGVSDQDLRVAGLTVEAHRGLILVLNKWDLLKDDVEAQKKVKFQLEAVLKFAPWAPVLTLSAKTGKGVGKLLPVVDEVFAAYNRRLETGPLNKALSQILAHHTPPMVKGRRLKFYYATQVGTRPPTIVIFVNDPPAVHFSYRRYLNNALREALGLKVAPLRLRLAERSGRKTYGAKGRRT